jgi:uncharacterized protein YdeI (YjbR/CyaY-like superfamily)
MPLSDVPADISRALGDDQAAREAFAGLAPSHVREYLRWIDEAKRAATRQRRIGGMIERLKDSKTRRGNGEG